MIQRRFTLQLGEGGNVVVPSSSRGLGGGFGFLGLSFKQGIQSLF